MTTWPTQAQVRQFYGEPGGPDCTAGMCDLAYPMRIAWDKDQVIRRFRCHVKVEAAFERIFKKTLAVYGLEEIQRLGVPFCVHNRREGPAGDHRFDSFLYMHTVGRPVETVIQFVGLLYSGVAERFPQLRIGFLECGVGWVPYWMERADEE